MLESSAPPSVDRTDYIVVPLPNGISLGARLWLPAYASSRPVPALVDYHPYRSCDFSALDDDALYSNFASNGYACVKLDVRGTGNSSGEYKIFTSEDYWEDGAAALEWIAKQPWCNGRTGMIGLSWPAHSALMVATKRPSSLKAIVPVAAAADRFSSRYHGGCLLINTVWRGPLLGGMHARPPLPWVVGDAWRDLWSNRLNAFQNHLEAWLSHPTDDSYWESGSAVQHLSKVECPVFSIAGWADPGTAMGVPRLLAGLKTPSRGMIGPWGHCFPSNAMPGPGLDFVRLVSRWLDPLLKSSNAMIEQDRDGDGNVSVWITDSAVPDASATELPGYWIENESLPSKWVTHETLRLGPGRLAKDGHSDAVLTVRSPLTVGACSGEWMPWYPAGPGPSLAEDQRQDDAHSVVFDTRPLEESLELLGTGAVEVEISSDRPSAQVVVRLCDVSPDGASSRITFGFLNLCYRDGNTKLVDVVPGSRYEVTIPLNPIGWRVPAGHRIRLSVSSCYWPMIWPSRHDSTLSLYLAGCAVRLPVRRGPRAQSSLPIVDGAKPSSHALAQATKSSARRAHKWDVGSRTLEILIEDADEVSGLDRAKLDIGSSLVRRYSIHADDPLSAKCETVASWTLRRGEWEVALRASAVVSATENDFHIDSDIVAREGGAVFYQTQKKAIVPRGPI